MTRTTTLFAVLLLAVMAAAPGCGIRKGISDAFEGLGLELDPLTPTDAVTRAFFDYDADVRRDAISRISAAPFGGEEEYVKMYRLLFKDEPDPTVRAALIHALGEHGDVQDAPGLARELHIDNPVFVRWEAAKALRQIHNPAVIDKLVDAVRDDPDADVRASAADALGQYAENRVFHTLVGALDDKDYKVTLAAHRSLKTLTGQAFDTDGLKWNAWEHENTARLFDGQEVYTYAPYVKPRGWLDKAQFWKDKPAAESPTPKGITRGEEPAPAGSEDDSSS